MTSIEMVRAPLGVGILGAGPVTQAIHLPTLARLSDLFAIRKIMDVEESTAVGVTRRVPGATATTDAQDLLDDPDVEVVAVCSPHAFHAEQVIAACYAGKKAILCEKPFAVSRDEAARIAAVSAETGVPIVVGAMHAYDAGWRRARETTFVPHTIRSSIVLPPNARFEDFATEILARPVRAAPTRFDSTAVAGAISAAIMGLAIHDLPLVRQLLERVSEGAWRRAEVRHAELLAPFGYLVVLDVAGVTVELHGLMSENWAPDWRLTAVGAAEMLDITFTPSYVQAGSGTTVISTARETRRMPPEDSNGYDGEWREVAAVARGETPQISPEDLIDDLSFAVHLAEAASQVAADTLTAQEVA